VVDILWWIEYFLVHFSVRYLIEFFVGNLAHNHRNFQARFKKNKLYGLYLTLQIKIIQCQALNIKP